MEQLLQAYGLPLDASILPITSGIINHTYRVNTSVGHFILQQVNTQVFKAPKLIHQNIAAIDNYLKQYHPNYLLPVPLQNLDGQDLVEMPNQVYYRLFPFIENSHTIDVVATPDQAFEAAFQFGQFTANLNGFDANQLATTIPHFHNLTLRFEQFKTALINGNPDRIKLARFQINELLQFEHLVKQFEAIQLNPQFKIRVTHHDTKISNVLFNQTDQAICVIDLDTVMPGYFISDVGDMMRTYLCPVSENESDIDQIVVRPDYYYAIVKGYQQAMQDVLTDTEKTHFFYAGQFMIYMQALRFLTDYLNNDIYYQIQYNTHNLVRAINQIELLNALMRYEKVFKQFSV